LIDARELSPPPPPPDSLGARLLVAVPAECPADLAEKIVCHNRAAAAWQLRLDTLDADVATAGRVSRERSAPHVDIMAAIAALSAEQKDVFTLFRELLAARMLIVKEIFDRGVEDRAPIIAAVQEILKRTGWPWNSANRG